MKKFLLLGLTTVAAFSASATLFVGWTNGANATFANGGFVADGNHSGWVDLQTVSASGTIQSLAVILTVSGGWNGDLFAYLVHDTGFAVLMDRVGYSGSGFGYGNPGVDITLTSAGNPIENYQGFSPVYNLAGQLTGAWQAHSGLENFIGLTAGGTWSLFLADLGPGDVSQVQSWGVQMDIVAVPEVETWIAAALAGAFGAFWLNRAIWKGVVPPSNNRPPEESR
jgi:hypothetical protein